MRFSVVSFRKWWFVFSYAELQTDSQKKSHPKKTLLHYSAIIISCVHVPRIVSKGSLCGSLKTTFIALWTKMNFVAQCHTFDKHNKHRYYLFPFFILCYCYFYILHIYVYVCIWKTNHSITNTARDRNKKYCTIRIGVSAKIYEYI